jgi:TPR repeat protein
VAHDVFISYSSRDKPAADAICAKLESRGVRCWIAPRDIQPGMSWGAAIIEAIDRARVMLLVFSSHANNSPQIKREVERSVSKEQIIIPVRVDEVKPTGDFEYFLGTPHWLDAITAPFEQHLEKIADSAKFWLERIESDAGATSPQPHRESIAPPPVVNAPSSPMPARRSFESISVPSAKPSRSSNRLRWFLGAAVVLAVLAIVGFFGARYYAAQQVAQERAKEQAAAAEAQRQAAAAEAQQQRLAEQKKEQQAVADAEARKEADEKARIAAQAQKEAEKVASIKARAEKKRKQAEAEEQKREQAAALAAAQKHAAELVVSADAALRQHDYGVALGDYKDAAAEGNSNGEAGLGLLYRNGWGVDKDYAEANEWYRKSAEQGNAVGERLLGDAYYAGEGVDKDYSEAVKWYLKSAEQGDAVGEANLAAMYETGWGVDQDISTAISWYQKAAAQGNEDAKENLARLRPSL